MKYASVDSRVLVESARSASKRPQHGLRRQLETATAGPVQYELKVTINGASTDAVTVNNAVVNAVDLGR